MEDKVSQTGQIAQAWFDTGYRYKLGLRHANSSKEGNNEEQ